MKDRTSDRFRLGSSPDVVKFFYRGPLFFGCSIFPFSDNQHSKFQFNQEIISKGYLESLSCSESAKIRIILNDALRKTLL